MATRIGVDVGGTFTDLIFLDDETGQVRVGKGPSNPSAVDEAVRAVVAGALDEDDSAQRSTSSTARPSDSTPCSSARAPV